MGRLGPGELLVILLTVLLVWGPAKLPELGRSLGRALREFREGWREETGGPNRPPPDAPR